MYHTVYGLLANQPQADYDIIKDKLLCIVYLLRKYTDTESTFELPCSFSLHTQLKETIKDNLIAEIMRFVMKSKRCVGM